MGWLRAKYYREEGRREPEAITETLGAILDEWLAFQQVYGRKERTIKTTANAAARIKSYFGSDRPLEEIDSDALSSFVRWRQTGPSLRCYRDPEQLDAGYLDSTGERWVSAHRYCAGPTQSNGLEPIRATQRDKLEQWRDKNVST